MASSLQANRRDHAEATTNAEIQTLARRLVKKIRSEADAAAMGKAHADGNERKVLLDIDVDGVRCLFVRRPPQLSQARVVLSPREREIARMIAKGYPNKTIARVLDISTWTVGTYLRRVFAKLNVSSRAAMVAMLSEEEQGLGLVKLSAQQSRNGLSD
ncbi:MAG TPA: helix-turn-helix transcriptional regulator [Gemmataceae bacterium]|nr:helix-turn-helix transcriptional regulator [Gemmataceae bacterium]